MDLARLKVRFEGRLPADLEGLFVEFTRASGSQDAERFFAYLRDRELIAGSLFAELHDASNVEIAKLLGVRKNGTLVLAGPADATVLAGAAAAPAPETANPDEPAVRYQILGRLGSGAMGEVHIARDVELRRKVALKRMAPDMARSQSLAARFFGEAQVTAQLDHPNIVPIYGLEVAPDGTLGYSMKLVQGRTLAQLLDDARTALAAGGPAEEQRRITARVESFLKVCDAMAYAHSKGVLQRDLKPDNIMLGRYHEVYVMDWGICRQIGSAESDEERATFAGPASPEMRTQYGAVMGTPLYMSPEQALGKNPELDGRSDLYTLGLILQEVITLKHARLAGPVTAVLARAAAGERTPALHLDKRVTIARELAAILDRACALELDQRYRSVAELAEDLRRYLRGEAVRARPDTMPQRIGRQIARHRMGVAITLLILLLAGMGCAALMLWHEQKMLGMARRHERMVGEFTTAVSRQGQAIDDQFHNHAALLAVLGGRVAEVLSRAAPTDEKFYLNEDYAVKGRQPADLTMSAIYQLPVSVEYPTFKLAPGVALESVKADIRRLSLLRGAFRETLLSSGHAEHLEPSAAEVARLIRDVQTPLVHVYVSLANGVHCGYPGQGGYPAEYDGRLRPKYLLAANTHGVRWGNAYADHLGHGLLLPGAIAIWDDARRFLGVAGIDVTFDYVIDELLDVAGAPPEAESFLVDGEGQVVVDSHDRKEKGDPAYSNAPLALHPLPWPRVIEAIRAKKAGVVDERGRISVLYPVSSLAMWFVVSVPDRALMR